MIGRLTGKIVYIGSDHLIIDIVGVGYIVYCSNVILSNTLINEDVTLFIETHVREDQITLYGFKNFKEKECFLKLTTVKGIGPKLALQILSSLTVDQIYIGISHKDQKMFSGISGVGPKIITRIFTELKAQDFISTSDIKSPSFLPNSNEYDAISALVNLGINKIEASRIVTKVISMKSDLDLNQLIKASLAEVKK